MMFENAARKLQPANPFAELEAQDPLKLQYERRLNELARHFIYDAPGLDPAKIEKAIAAARHEAGMAEIEEKEHGLESLSHLIKGIAAHERANAYHLGAWQAELSREETPEKLSREQAARKFEGFIFKKPLIDSELEALKHYEQLLGLNQDSMIELSRNISLRRTDIEVLINDIRVRMAERIPDDAERKEKLAELDKKLADIIQRIPDEEQGKRFEMEEIYLLRRLIHTADTGHLASVSHGTPREDLRANLGSVDAVITAAGDKYDFQLKTFKYGVSKIARQKQSDVLEKARQNLERSGTYLTVLEAEAIQKTYEAALRQTKTERTSRADKFAALEPMARILSTTKSHRLLALLGLTEDDLAREQAEFDRKVEERKKHEQEMELRREEMARRTAEVEEAYNREVEARRQREADERARQQMIEEKQRQINLASQLKHKAAIEAEQRKYIRLKAKMDEAAKREKMKKEEEAKFQRERVKKEAQRMAREAKKQENLDWPPKTIVDLKIVSLLEKMGISPKDPTTFLGAKKGLIQLFGDAKKGVATEADKINRKFKEIFPTKESYEAPSKEKLEQLRELVLKK